uniref:Iorf2 protein protein n=1 Tax=Bovine coronavirus TaxID=11128 RepID=Q65ZR1_9BETC|nr:hypothetical protein 2 - bovine coronavirus [Bovine coronavirus]AAB19564.1 Iorf2 protein [Bovine coronavirus]
MLVFMISIMGMLVLLAYSVVCYMIHLVFRSKVFLGMIMLAVSGLSIPMADALLLLILIPLMYLFVCMIRYHLFCLASFWVLRS